MSLNTYELWLKSLEADPGIQLHNLGDGLFMTKRKYEHRHNYYFTGPVFHLFLNGKHLTFMDYMEAYRTQQNHRKEQTWKNESTPTA